MITIDNKKCTMCGACAGVCPNLIIEKVETRMEPVHAYSCLECYHCVAVCPEGAVSCGEFPLDEFKPLKSVAKASPAEVEALLACRRSVREFKDKPVPAEFLEKLVAIAGSAPTARNAQGVELSVVTDRALMDRLDRRIMKKMGGLLALTGSPLLEGPVRLFGGSKTAEKLAEKRADFERYARAEGTGGLHVFRGAPVLMVAHNKSDVSTGKDDCVIALSHVMFAAGAHGLGATWIGYLPGVARFDSGLKKPLGVPASNTIHAAIILGWPKYKYQRAIPRKPVPVKWI